MFNEICQITNRCKNQIKIKNTAANCFKKEKFQKMALKRKRNTWKNAINLREQQEKVF